MEKEDRNRYMHEPFYAFQMRLPCRQKRALHKCIGGTYNACVRVYLRTMQAVRYAWKPCMENMRKEVSRLTVCLAQAGEVQIKAIM